MAPANPQAVPGNSLPAHLTKSRRSLVIPLVVAASLLVVALGVWLVLDLDGDKVVTFRELQYHTSPFKTDTDGDGLDDGWEITHSTNPLDTDTDHDGLNDRLEIVHGTSPFKADSDFDGLADLPEVQAGTDPLSGDSDHDGIPDATENGQDCNHDGINAALQLDDDSDGRPDGQEPATQRCSSDSDHDGVLDGQEQAVACVTVVDCDGDGLPDSVERDTQFSPLTGDSLASGLGDAVAKEFKDLGQLPSQDSDHDGIPDSWEAAGGNPPMPWGVLQPLPGQRDLLVEFLRVQGPDSARVVGDKSFTSAYDGVAAMFLREEGIHLTYTETVVNRADDPLGPHGLNPNATYYQYAFEHARFANNPYVNIVVLAPHLGQAIPHSGIGQLRGMFAAIDYSQFVTVGFTDSKGRSFTTSPSVEEDPANVLGVISGTEIPVIKLWSVSFGATGYVPVWQGYWFHTTPVLQDSKNALSAMTQQAVTVYQAALASTMAHELGHNLGLCHAHEPSCYANFTAADQLARDTSTMSYNSNFQTLHFLPSEWATVSQYLACPPTATLQLLAKQAPTAEVWNAKFVSSQERTCGSFNVVDADLSFQQSPPQSYALAEHEKPAPLAVPTNLSPAFAAIALLAALASGLGSAWWLRRMATA